MSHFGLRIIKKKKSIRPSPTPSVFSIFIQSFLHTPFHMAGTAEKRKREAVIAMLTTPANTRKALANVTTVTTKRGLLNDQYELYWCHEKVDTRGSRAEASGRSARPMINVQDGEEETARKNSHASESPTTKKRNTKNTNSDGTKITYTKYLAHHVVLYAAGRRIPSGDLHGSHLCQNERCMRASHIRVENQTLNQQRKGCSGLLVCEVCDNRWQTCKHHATFKCLTVTFFICCDKAQRVQELLTVPAVVDEVSCCY